MISTVLGGVPLGGVNNGVKGLGMKRLLFASVLAIAVTLPANAFAGHGLGERGKLDHPAPAFAPSAPAATTVNSGGEGAEWGIVTTIATGNPHTDLDFFTQNGDMYASVGTLAVGANAGGQTVVQLTDGGEVSPQFVSAHPSAAALDGAPLSRSRGVWRGRL